VSLQVAIDARLNPGIGGGIESVVIGLAQGFSNLDQSEIELTFVVFDEESEWLTQHVKSDKILIHAVPRPGARARWAGRARVWAIRPQRRSFGVLPAPDRVMARLTCDVVHYPFQDAGLVPVPFIYHPHDLQHRHFPEYFSQRVVAGREVRYRALCERAAKIAVASTWVKEDLIASWNLPPDRIAVVPLAPVVFHDLASNSRHLAQSSLPNRYIVYPAATWPHKNHGRLLEALGTLRGRGIRIPLVLTGARVNRGADIPNLAILHGVADQVYDLGYVSGDQLSRLVSDSSGLILPSLFEAASFPIWEAFRVGVPVACSAVTSLPRQAGGNAILFDPQSPGDIARALELLWCDSKLCRRLVLGAKSHVAEFSWTQTARHFVALYRELAGYQLCIEDRAILGRAPKM